MNATHFALCSLSLLVGCASGSTGQSTTSDPGTAESSRADETTEATSQPTVAASKPMRLQRGVHLDAMTEVALDAKASAALTLDDRGGLRLWPDLGAADAAAPIVLPEIEATWFSLARAGDHDFVIATIDTAGGARVARIEVNDGVAQRHALFELPATDPQFEIHALEGGERILALGKDHRVRLFDNTGKVISEIDQRGFIPWQLRVVQTPGQPVAVAAVLTQPVRAQALTIDGDQLRTVGEPWMVALDQSPNRNDMSLSPDGKTIAALRRHGKRGKGGFALQLIELATGTRRVIVGALDTKARPRLHFASNDRVLLESGSGKGFWVELAQAVPRDATTFPPAVMQTVPLPDALGDLRMQVAEAAGVRAIATGNVLTIDSLASTDHLRVTRQSLSPRAVALDSTGGRLAWASGSKVFLDDTRGDGSLPEGFDVGASVEALGFDDAAHLLIGTATQTLVRDTAGHEVAAASTPPVLPRFDAKRAAQLAQGASAGLQIRGTTPVVAYGAPTGSLLALGQRVDNVALSHRTTTAFTLVVFDRDEGRRRWSHELGDIRNIAWSGDASHLVTDDGRELVVLDAATGARTFARAPQSLVATTVADETPMAPAR